MEAQRISESLNVPAGMARVALCEVLVPRLLSKNSELGAGGRRAFAPMLLAFSCPANTAKAMVSMASACVPLDSTRA